MAITTRGLQSKLESGLNPTNGNYRFEMGWTHQLSTCQSGTGTKEGILRMTPKRTSKAHFLGLGFEYGVKALESRVPAWMQAPTGNQPSTSFCTCRGATLRSSVTIFILQGNLFKP